MKWIECDADTLHALEVESAYLFADCGELAARSLERTGEVNRHFDALVLIKFLVEMQT